MLWWKGRRTCLTSPSVGAVSLPVKGGAARQGDLLIHNHWFSPSRFASAFCYSDYLCNALCAPVWFLMSTPLERFPVLSLRLSCIDFLSKAFSSSSILLSVVVPFLLCCWKFRRRPIRIVDGVVDRRDIGNKTRQVDHWLSICLRFYPTVNPVAVGSGFVILFWLARDARAPTNRRTNCCLISSGGWTWNCFYMLRE